MTECTCRTAAPHRHAKTNPSLARLDMYRRDRHDESGGDSAMADKLTVPRETSWSLISPNSLMYGMNTRFRTARILVPPRPASTIRHRSFSFRTFNAPNVNSANASYNPSFGAEGNLRVAPKEMPHIPNLTLNDGKEIPLLGFGLGTARVTSRSKGNGLDKELVKTIVMAIKSGFHHLDGAEAYGNEAELGQAIKDSGIPRSHLFVTTKIQGTQPVDTEASFAASLEHLGLDYVDLYLIHAPYFASSPADLQRKWAEMEAIQASGRARSIGVSNFLQPDLEAVLDTAKVVPAVNQIEYHPYLQHGSLLEFQRQRGIATAAYGPLTAVLKGSPGPLDEVYKRLARKYGVTEVEIALRWCIDHGVVALTTSDKEQRLKSYLKIADFKLTPIEVEEINEVGKEKHFRSFWSNRFAPDDRR